ncbi:MAG: tripartite tricarboxylate transporter substrate binding protein [Nocardioidaceae bacterium]
MNITRPRKRSARTLLVTVLASTSVLLAASCGGAFDTQEQQAGASYPTQPVTMTAPAEPGSGWDTTARALAQVLEEESLTDSALPVQNRTGATGCVWHEAMVNDYAGDPYQIAITSTPIMSNYLRGDCDLTYKDVTMIATVFVETYILVTPADSPYKTADDLINAIKKDPQSVPIAASGDDQLPFALLVRAAGGDPASINFIEYEGGGEQITAMLNGDVEAALAGVSEFRGQLEAGDLRGLAVLKDERLTGPLGDIPTAPELGYDVTLANWRGVYGPPRMPDSAVTYWQETLRKAVETPSWKKVAEQNQWEPLYLEGQEMESYLADANSKIKQGLADIGALE